MASDRKRRTAIACRPTECMLILMWHNCEKKLETFATVVDE